MDRNQILSGIALVINHLHANSVLEPLIAEATVKRWLCTDSVFTQCLSRERREWPDQLNVGERITFAVCYKVLAISITGCL